MGQSIRTAFRVPKAPFFIPCWVLDRLCCKTQKKITGRNPAAASPYLALLGGDASFLEEPVMLLAFVLLGRALESRAKARVGAKTRTKAGQETQPSSVSVGRGVTQHARVGRA
jgi:hypothetical protein